MSERLGHESPAFTLKQYAHVLPLVNRSLPGLSVDSVFSDIVDLDYDSLLHAARMSPGEASLLHGGPPCTPFSKSGYWLAYKRAGEDPKASLLDNYVESLRAVRPKAFLMENVYGLAYQNQNRPILNRLGSSVFSSFPGQIRPSFSLAEAITAHQHRPARSDAASSLIQDQTP